jgi:hypothetical protein
MGNSNEAIKARVLNARLEESRQEEYSVYFYLCKVTLGSHSCIEAASCSSLQK